MNWAYLAGFTDGDGCITRELAKGKYHFARLRWAQKQANSAVLYQIAAFLREHGIKVSTRNFSVARVGHKYPQVDLGITNADDTRKALEEMLPYLVVKKQRAEEALEILRKVAEAKAKYGWKYRAKLLKETANG